MFLIKPKHADKKVMNPDPLGRLAESGIIVKKVSTYWKRRLADNDVIIEDMKKTSKRDINKKDEGVK